MPVYEYVCRKCGKKFMEILRLTEVNKKILCPKCSSASVQKCIEPFFAATAKKS
jgi:putative FmdB family regulatory protein